jgi:hypothetical protein
MIQTVIARGLKEVLIAVSRAHCMVHIVFDVDFRRHVRNGTRRMTMLPTYHKRLRWRSLTLFPAVVILWSSSVSAETRFEGAAGYSVSRYGSIQPVGWFVSIAAKPTHWFAIASELTAEFHTDNTGLHPVKHSGFVFVDGPRFTWAMPWSTSLFGEVLVGVAHGREFTPGETRENRFVWQPGGGVDVRLSQRLAARFHVQAMADGANVFSPDATRFSSGLVMMGTPSKAERARALEREKARAARKAQREKDKEALEDAKHRADMAEAAARESKALAEKAEAEAKRKAAAGAAAPPSK